MNEYPNILKDKEKKQEYNNNFKLDNVYEKNKNFYYNIKLIFIYYNI